jgi:signal transduction histidine kinase
MKIHIYRIIQEGLNNIIKHADANLVILKVKKSNKAINISIQDDGKGFDYKKYKTDHNQSKGLGLVNIAEQVKILNGNLNINTALKKGTRLLITIPKEKSG